MASNFKSEDALKAAETLMDQIVSLKSELRDIQIQYPEQFQLEENHLDDLEKEVVEMAQNTKVLKESVPEGSSDDSNVQYYLAIAELEKNNGVLRQQQKISQDNLKSLDKDLEGTKNLITEMKQIKSKLESIKTDDQENNPNSGNKNISETDIDKKIHATRKLYSELKNFLGEFLGRINDENLGAILQTLWDAFQDQKDDRYVQISHLDFDVEKSHLDLLVKNGIAELDPSDSDKIRLLDFTITE